VVPCADYGCPPPFPLPSPSRVLFALPCLPLCPSLPLSLPLPLLMVVPSCMALAFAGALCATNCTNRVADFSSGMPSSIGIYCMSITSTSAARYVVREFYRASGQQTLPWPCVSHTHTHTHRQVDWRCCADSPSARSAPGFLVIQASTSKAGCCCLSVSDLDCHCSHLVVSVLFCLCFLSECLQTSVPCYAVME